MRILGLSVVVCLQACASVGQDVAEETLSIPSAGDDAPAAPATTEELAAPDRCVAELEVPSPVAACATPVDAAAVEACSAGHAALHEGRGYDTLAEAIAAAGIGEEVTVCPGTFSGPVVVDRPILLGAADPRPGATVIDGGSDGRGVEILARALVRGFTILGREGAPAPSGVLAEADGVVLECLTLEDHRAGAVGGPGRDLTVRTSTFRGNRAPGGGAAIAARSGLRVEDCAFVQNASSAGGAVTAGGDLTITRSWFERNFAEVEAGALAWSERAPAALEIEDSVFLCNGSGGEAGAVRADGGAQTLLTIAGATFAGNVAASQGGALEVDAWGALDLALLDSTFTTNGSSYGGALLVVGPMEGGVAAALDGVAFTDNVTERGGSAVTFDVGGPTGAVEARELALLRNRGGSGAVDLSRRIELTCTDCDLGSGDDDNLPHDVAKAGAEAYDLAGRGTFEL